MTNSKAYTRPVQSSAAPIPWSLARSLRERRLDRRRLDRHGRRRIALPRPREELVAAEIEGGAADFFDVDRKVALGDPAQEAPIGTLRQLVERRVRVLAEPEHDHVAVPLQMARRSDPARPRSSMQPARIALA